MIVDTSVLIALLREEPEASQFLSVLTAEYGNLRLSAASYLEAGIVIDGNRDAALSARLDALISLLAIEIVAVSADHARRAREAYRTYGKGYHPARINFGDCFAYALAIDTDEPLLFKGDDFVHTDVRRPS